jgi:hypothetical protein
MNRDSYRQEWNIVMSATDSQWAQPDMGTTPLNYTCLYRYTLLLSLLCLLCVQICVDGTYNVLLMQFILLVVYKYDHTTTGSYPLY